MPSQYFTELKEWSARKHELLIKYLDGFVRILGGVTGGKVYYVDGFAGPGLYDVSPSDLFDSDQACFG